jgi:DNA-binding MarR family transcriptional regulator
MKTDIQLNSENFELYFLKQIESMTEAAKEALPGDISRVLLYRDGRVRKHTAYRLGFLAKLWVLWRCAKKRVWIVVENEDSGLNLEEFVALGEAIKQRDFGVPRAEDLQVTARFVTSDRELSNTFDYLSRVSNSPAYNYLVKEKNFKPAPNKMAEHDKRMRYLVRVIRDYESNKRRWMQSKGLTKASFLALLYFYDREECSANALAKEVTRGSSFAGRTLSNTVAQLSALGYVERTGVKKNSLARITPKGTSVINYIINNYVI